MSASKTYTSILKAAQSLCDSISSHSSTLLYHFSSSPTAYEHGHPDLGPFLGRSFTGREGITDYFAQLQKYLSYEDMTFRDYVVDEVQKKVSVAGKAKFTWTATNIEWHEVFTYTLGFVEEEGEWKAQSYQVWADSGSLYLASLGKKPSDLLFPG